MTIRKRTQIVLVCALLGLSLAACKTSSPTAAPTVPVVETIAPTPETATPEAGEITSPVAWFTPPASLAAGWDISMVAGQSETVLLEPKAGEAQFQLFFLLTRGHVLYDRAIEVVLTTFQDRGIIASATLALAMDPDTKSPDLDLCLAALQYAEGNGYDLIYPIGSDATAVVHENYRGGALPVVSLLAKDPVLLGQIEAYDVGSGTNIAYTSVSVPVDVQMIYFRQLIPDLKNIVVLYDLNNASTVKTQVEPLDIYAQENGFNVIHIAVTQVETNDATRAELQALFPPVMNNLRHDDPNNDQSIFLLTNSGTIEQVFDVVVTLAGDIPVVSLLPEVVQAGEASAVMSVGVSFDSNSILAAVYGIRILQDGEAPGSLPVGVIRPPDIAINFLKARQINLRIPFTLFESASQVYDADGVMVREKGQRIP